MYGRLRFPGFRTRLTSNGIRRREAKMGRWFPEASDTLQEKAPGQINEPPYPQKLNVVIGNPKVPECVKREAKMGRAFKPTLNSGGMGELSEVVVLHSACKSHITARSNHA